MRIWKLVRSLRESASLEQQVPEEELVEDAGLQDDLSLSDGRPTKQLVTA